jgi:BirA family biotin operon repressor/biotin-[acetyl-CoA-carboxylase] ligase
VDESDLLIAWRDQLETLGRRVSAHGAGIQISGQAVDVDSDGVLLIKTDDGTIHGVIAGEVTLAE